MAKKTLFQKVLQKMTHSKDKTPSGLKKYPLVVLGANVGGTLTHNLTNATHGSVPLMSISPNEISSIYSLRPFFQQRRIAIDKFSLGSKQFCL